MSSVSGHSTITSNARFFASVTFALAISTGIGACASDPKSIDFGAGVDPSQPAPRGRPYPCPPEVPESQSICTTRDLSCTYDPGTCVCNADVTGMFGALAWNCPFDAPAESCPPTEPQPETACTSLLGAPDCSYGRQVACHCSGEAQTWACWDPANCPKGRPDDAAACDPVGMACRYAAKSCECYTAGWQCSDAI
jgi:hypothetical protein